MPSPNFLLGPDAHAYYAAALFTAANAAAVEAASLTEFTTAMDVDPDLSQGDVDITTRLEARDGWRVSAPTLKEATVPFKMRWKPGDAGFEKIKDAWLGGDEIGMAFLDQDKSTAGAQGPAGNWIVTGFQKHEPIEGAQTVDVTVKMSSYPQWYVKGS